MKHLKTYKVFEAQTETHWETYDIFHDFFDEFEYIVPDFVHERPHSYNLQAHSRRYGGIEIEDSYHFNAKCLKIRISDNRLLKSGNFKNFDGINNGKYSEMLQECHLRMIDFLNPVDVFVGSVGVYNRDLDILYFYDKPDLKRYAGVDIYGSNIAVSLDKLGIDLVSNSRHSNCFNAYNSGAGHIQGVFYLMGYYDDEWRYVGKISEKDESRRNNKPLLDWIDSEWDEVCRRLKIKDFQKIKDYNNPKITIAEFLSILRNNQDNYAPFSRN